MKDKIENALDKIQRLRTSPDKNNSNSSYNFG